LTVALAVYALSRFGSARYQVEPGTPLLEKALEQAAPVGPVSEQRRRELRLHDNLWEPARALARQWFEAAAGGRVGAGTPPVPAFRLGGRAGWWRRRTVARRVRRLWRLARDDTPRRITARQLRRWHEDIRELDAARADGTLRFGEGDSE